MRQRWSSPFGERAAIRHANDVRRLSALPYAVSPLPLAGEGGATRRMRGRAGVARNPRTWPGGAGSPSKSVGWPYRV
jgi:hypothetical protein